MIINKYILDIYIYIYNPSKILCHPGFHGVFCKTIIIRQLRRWNSIYLTAIKKELLNTKYIYIYIYETL